MDVLRLYLLETESRELLERALRVEYLSAAWREDLNEKFGANI
jgi:hypothetical protein